MRLPQKRRDHLSAQLSDQYNRFDGRKACRRANAFNLDEKMHKAGIITALKTAEPAQVAIPDAKP